MERGFAIWFLILIMTFHLQCIGVAAEMIRPKLSAWIDTSVTVLLLSSNFGKLTF